MRLRSSPVFFPLALALAASPAAAQLNAYYEGYQVQEGKRAPITTQYSIDNDRAAAVFKGLRSTRMIYFKKDKLLRIIDDDTKSYVDLSSEQGNQLSQQMTEMQGQMAKMPAEQREMAEKMMGQAMGNLTAPEPPIYVKTDAKQTVKGYECTRVDILRGKVKHAEYWGTTSQDFVMTPEERATGMGMHEAMSSLTILSSHGGPNAETRPFDWDTKTEGFPLICRCFAGEDTLLDVRLTSFDKKPLDGKLFEVPKGYKRQDLGGGMAGGNKHGKRG